jgi:hypothetical protein
VLARSLADAGFDVPRPLSPEAAIGLGPLGELPRVPAAALLRSYRDLVTRPWPSRDDLRRALVDGMRAAALDGTGSALARRGLLVKTGTVPSLDGHSLATSGWALAASPGGESLALGLLADGTGAAAASALGDELHGPRRAIAPPRPGGTSGPAARLVRIRILEALRPAAVTISNAGASPVRVRRSSGTGEWLGPGASLSCGPGLAVGPGLLRIAVEPYGLVRFVDGTLEVLGRPGSLRLVLSSTPRDWVEGVLRGELRDGSTELREELAGTSLRFLRAGPRHGSEDLCDSTHCAVFNGRGPLVTWVTPRRAAPAGRGTPLPPLLDDTAWERIVALSGRPGPSHFTGHCGGAPLSSYSVWGRGPREAPPCPRHGPAEDARWERFLPDGALAAAFGGPVVELHAVVVSGVRKTRVATRERTVVLLYDELHGSLAAALGWDALPSPPDLFVRADGGFFARGRGRGHRVGLCLAPPSR